MNLNKTEAVSTKKLFLFTWVLGLLFYALEYSVRTSPSIMLPELSKHFNISTPDLSGLLVSYYITYAATSLLAGILLDKFGAKFPLFIGTVILGVGCILFVFSDFYTGYTARLLQGMGSAIAFPTCVYLAVRAFPPKNLATAIGVTQSLGILGGSAGQFAVPPLLPFLGITAGLQITVFWIILGIISFLIGSIVLVKTPKEKLPDSQSNSFLSFLEPYKIVFSNIQSYLCGITSGLLFAPTTIFFMTWGIAFFQSDFGLSHSMAAIACALVPVGWAIGCPLMGWLADKTSSRINVLRFGCVLMIFCLVQMVYFPELLHVYVTTLVFGIASGVAMLPYSIIKEVNPDKVKGSATGAINFITFGITSLMGPLFNSLHGKTLENTVEKAKHMQNAGTFFIYAIILALIITLFLKETGKNNVKNI